MKNRGLISKRLSVRRESYSCSGNQGICLPAGSYDLFPEPERVHGGAVPLFVSGVNGNSLPSEVLFNHGVRFRTGSSEADIQTGGNMEREF